MTGPVRVHPDPEGVPAELREVDQWVCWRVEERDGDPTKVPIDPTTGGRASSTDAGTWADFPTAWDHYTDPDSRVAGIGFVFDADGPYAGVDADDCRDPESGTIDEWARDVLDTLDTYAEVSPSGTGVHAILRGEVPDGGNRSGDVEIYDSARYFTVTGDRLGLTPSTVEERQDELEAVHAEYITDGGGGGADEAVHTDETPGETTTPSDLSDDDLITKATAARNGDTFRDLWSGDTSGYPSHSEADLALCNLLAYWAGPDASRIDRLFRRSGLCRDKWTDREDYRGRTIRKAIADTSEFYDPGSGDATDDADGGGPLYARFKDACEEYAINPHAVATGRTDDGEKIPLGLDAVLPDPADADVGDAVMAFNRQADRLSGTDKQAVVGQVVRLDLEAEGEFFETTDGRLYYFHGEEREVYRVDGDGNRVLTEDFQGMVWERYNLFAGRFSRNLGKDIRTKARRAAPTKEAYRFAHYDELSGELYVADWGDGYHAVSADGIEWRPNGTDVYFLTEEYAASYQYLDPDDRPTLPDALPGELAQWGGRGDALMRLFGNRINYDESAALGPSQQRNQLYLHLHALPFIDLLNARPIMAWVGEKGSGKTVIERSIGRFIYGDGYTESIMPDAKDDFSAKVANQALAFIDNYDDGEEWANDVLAAVATGAGIDKRHLYTTNDLRREVPRCWLSITSRDPPFRRDDVADRTLVFRVERIEDGFVGMGDYLREVSHYRDLLWSAYLDNLQAIVREYARRDTASMSSAHRMADWAIFARIIANALGVDRVDELLETMETERATFALENEPWAGKLGEWVRANPDATQWRKASELVDAIDADGGPLSSAAGLGSKLSTYHSELGALYGLEIDQSASPYRYRFVTDTPAVPANLEHFA